MKSILTFSLALFTAVSANAEHGVHAADGADREDIRTYSNGYRLGIINRPKSWAGSHTVTMQVGLATSFVAVNLKYNDSDPASNIITNLADYDPTRHELVSPFTFAVWDKDLIFLNHGPLLMRKFSVIHYRERLFHRVGAGVLQSTPYIFVDGFTTTGKPFYPLYYEVKAGSRNFWSWGQRGGLIVKVSHRGHLYLKKWEIQIEEGSGDAASNNFITMTIQDNRLARYAILAMMTGLPVNVHYTEAALGGMARPLSSTNFDAYRIEFAKEILDPWTKRVRTLRTVPAALIESGTLRDIDNYVIQVMKGRPPSASDPAVAAWTRPDGHN